MAVRLQFINLIVPVATLQRVFAAEGGFAGYFRAQEALLGDMVWHDGHLCRVDGAMNWGDVDGMVGRWEALGLQGLVGVAPPSMVEGFRDLRFRARPDLPMRLAGLRCRRQLRLSRRRT